MTTPMKLVRAAGESMYGRLWQTELAAALGVSDRAVRRWVAGDANPPEDIMPRLRTVMDKRIEKLRDVRRSLPK
jgi:DNA-binding transcriptional regulator YiaG